MKVVPTLATEARASRFNRSPSTRLWAGYAAFAWVVVFALFHVYWYLGGRFGLGNASDPLPEWKWEIEDVLFTCFTIGAFIVGGAISLASVQPWGRRIPRSLIQGLLLAGCAVLTVRGGLGQLDEALRQSGILSNGLTGLTYEEIYGDASPSDYTLWSSVLMDLNFILGGLLFGLSARQFGARMKPPLIDNA